MISFFPSFRLRQLLIEVIRADIGLTFLSQLELLLEKEIVSGCALIFNVVFKVSFGECCAVPNFLYLLHYFLVHRDLVVPYVQAETANFIETSEPRMLLYTF
jgi:hypothetical protein